LNSIGLSNLQTNVHRKRSSALIPYSEESQSGNNTIIEDWLVERLVHKLRRAIAAVQHTSIPHLLYRTIICENEDALQEEIGMISRKHIVIMTYAYGGFVPSTFQKIEVYTLDKFTRLIVQNRKKDLLLQCLNSLE
jgi:hypothetical protein